jgi:DNA-binding transcriptional LysR family regulator
MHKSGLVELDAVVAVAPRGSFRGAAHQLGMSTTARGNSDAGLESRLGVRLFNRTTRSVSLSAAGAEFVAKVTPALSDIHDAMAGVHSHRDTPRGTLRINCAAGAARRILKPILLEYMRRFPEVNVDLVTEGRMVDIVVDGFDAGIRLNDTVPRDMIAVPIGSHVRYAVVGSPAYFEDHPRPRTPKSLMEHRNIRIRLPSGAIYRWEFERNGEALELDVPGTLMLDEPTLMLEAALEGAGLAYLSEWSVAPFVAAGRLVRVLKDWTPSSPGLCLYYPANRHPPAALRSFIQVLREAGKGIS